MIPISLQNIVILPCNKQKKNVTGTISFSFQVPEWITKEDQSEGQRCTLDTWRAGAAYEMETRGKCL